MTKPLSLVSTWRNDAPVMRLINVDRENHKVDKAGYSIKWDSVQKIDFSKAAAVF